MLEVATARTFAAALDWPGWCRSGRTPAEALAALSAYAPRYARVAHAADLAFPPVTVDDLSVVAQVAGNATTGFGAPGVPAAADSRDLPPADLDRQLRLLRAGWAELDRLARTAPRRLRKGPRGGGRDRDEVVEHVLEAERSYARRLGVRHPPYHGDRAAVAACRVQLEQALRAGPPAPATGPGWPPRYFLRRAAWHVLDHVWEIEDKSSPV